MAVLLMSGSHLLSAQKLDNIIHRDEVERIEKTLSADDMAGRAVGTPGIEKAATFISSEMKRIGLKTFPGADGYFQSFSMLQPVLVAAGGSINDSEISSDRIMAFTTTPLLELNEKSGYRIVRISASDTIRKKITPLLRAKENIIILIDPVHEALFKRIKQSKAMRFPSDFSQVLVLSSDSNAISYHFKIQHNIETQKLANVVGVLPGKSKKDEYVIFSSHYDHLGFGKPNAAMDSLYNGANDDASGVTAVLQLANYYKSVKTNQRTLIFVAFTAEETGGYGSQYFSKQVDPIKVSAMFNIEMIGTESKWGKNSAYITGYEKTDFGEILQKNLVESAFRFYPDPYPAQNLFYRSDNATLAGLGVPAHTISTSKMDSEPHYHKPSDEIGTLDLINMTEIIKSVAISAGSIVEGRDTPLRVIVD